MFERMSDRGRCLLVVMIMIYNDDDDEEENEKQGFKKWKELKKLESLGLLTARSDPVMPEDLVMTMMTMMIFFWLQYDPRKPPTRSVRSMISQELHLK